MKATLRTLSATAALLAAALGTSLAAAQSPGAPPPPAPSFGPAPPAGPPLPYFAPPPVLRAMHDALTLSDAQESLWRRAESAMRTLAEQNEPCRLPPPPPALGATAPSLREQARVADQDQDAMIRALRTARDRWIELDEALSAEQRAFVRGTMLGRHHPPPPPPPIAGPGDAPAPGRDAGGPG